MHHYTSDNAIFSYFQVMTKWVRESFFYQELA